MPQALLTVVLALGACRKAPPEAPGGPLPASVPGFWAGGLERASGYVRRSYARGAASLLVTAARYPMTDAQWDDWLKSAAAYPRAEVGLPPDRASGFYQCSPGPGAPCDILLQLRSGWHLELHAGEHARKEDADALARALPLAALAAGP